jgi:acyl transferase domain-containing protein/acyl carrier protein
MGQGALVENGLTTVRALFETLTDGASALLREGRPTEPAVGPWGPAEPVPGGPGPSVWAARPRAVAPVAADAPIAVVGLGCVLPGAPDVASFWRQLLFGMDAVRPIPADRWRADRYFDPDSARAGAGVTRTAVRMGGVVADFTFDPLVFGIPPRVVASMDRAQQLALVAARQAMADVKRVDARRTAVVLGNSMGGEHAKSLAVRVRFREVLAALDADGAFDDLDPDGLAALSDRVEARLSETLPPVDVESMSGLLANVIAGRVAAWLDVMGGNTTVDAACAASLAAIDTAATWLRSGRADLVLTGGVDADLAPETYVGFSRTYALSSTGSSPFSANADGFVMGEGAALFALKRLDDARRDGDRVWAVIRGVGQSSDGRSSGITAPRAEGQQLAIQRAYQQAGFGPDSVELVEAHGTGTAVGDRTELTALSRVFAGQDAWLGSVKSNIGHLKGGAGAAGLLKAVLSVAHRIAPPTLHATPLADGLARSPFSLPRTPIPLSSPTPRASVSAFGFGGTNFHVLLEADAPVSTGVLGVHPPHLPATAWSSSDVVPELRIYAADDLEGLLAALDAGHTCTPEEAVERAERLVVLDRPTGLRAWVASGASGAFGMRAFRGSGPASPAVWVYPGQGSPRDGALDALHAMEPSARAYAALGITDVDTSADPAAQHALLVTAGIGWSAVLREAGLGCAGVVGHSVGELAALVGAGRLEPASALALAQARGRGLMACPPGQMLAVALDEDGARALAQESGLHVAAHNSPQSAVLAGPTVDRATALAREQGVRCTVLDVERAFHTPAVQPASDALAEVVPSVTLSPGPPWWSNVGPVPDADDAIRAALVRAVVEPVGFAASIERALAEGHRLFVHVGPGRAMARHIEHVATAHDQPVQVVSLDPDPGDPRGIVTGAAALLAAGCAGLLRLLPARFATVPFPTEPHAPRRLETTALPPIAERAPPRAPSQSEARASATPVPMEGVRGAVLGAISEVTGYPPEALAAGARLDADLGIDSIRKMEIVGLVQERLGLAIDDAALAEIGTLDIDGLVAWLEAQTDTTSPVEAPDTPSEASRWRLCWVPERPDALHRVEALRVGSGSLQALVSPFLERALPECVVLDATDPAHHGVAAFLRVAAREADRAVSIAFSGGPAPDGDVPMGPPGSTILFDADRVWVRGFCLDATEAHDLPDAPVVLASGGATGILSVCLEALPGARGIVFGRREGQQAPDGFTYARCDVTDAAAVQALADRCRAEYGRIDLVVHAAGVLRDGLLAGRTPDEAEADLEAVRAVKIDGARNLIEATRADAPVWVPFSSVSAHLANPGQAFYAAANAMLEQLPHPTASRSIPLAWTAWSEVGMAADPTLQRLLASRGIQALRPTDGARLFREALAHAGPQWLAAAPPPSSDFTRLPWPLSGWDGQQLDADVSRFFVQLDPNAPALADHRVAGRPLVPAAVWVSALLGAARVRGLPNPAVEDLDILAPCFVSRTERVALTLADDTATVERDGTVLCRATLTRRTPDDDAPPVQTEPDREMEPARPLYRDDLLFHGPAWQMLVGLGPLDAQGGSADVRINGTDPVATTIDGAHQLLAAWSGRQTGWLGLPVGADAWQVHRQPKPGAVRLSLRARVQDGIVTGDVVARDRDGTLLLTGSGLRLRQASRWVDPE